jgi:hypothetical protein
MSWFVFFWSEPNSKRKVGWADEALVEDKRLSGAMLWPSQSYCKRLAFNVVRKLLKFKD